MYYRYIETKVFFCYLYIMVNCVVSTVSALADVYKDELEFQRIRVLTNKKETLMTQFSRVGLKLGSRVVDYDALRVGSVAPECATTQPLTQSDFPPTGKSLGNNNTTLGKTIISCFEIGPGTPDKPEKIVISIGNNNITIYGNLKIRENTTLYIEKGSTFEITGKLTMESNAKLVISDSTFLYNDEATLNNSIITVSGLSTLQGFTLDLQNTNCTLDFGCNVSIDGELSFENTTKSTITVGSKEYKPILNIKGVICN